MAIRVSGEALQQGVLRNSASEWRSGFVAHLGNGQVLDVELWGIYCGLRL